MNAWHGITLQMLNTASPFIKFIITVFLVKIVKSGCTASAGFVLPRPGVHLKACTRRSLGREITPREHVLSPRLQLPGTDEQLSLRSPRPSGLDSQTLLVHGQLGAAQTIKLDLMSLPLLFRDDASILP